MSGDHNMFASGSGDGQRSGWRKRQVLKMAEQASLSRQDWWKDDEALERFAEQVRAEEREACAGLCDRFANRMMSAEECADAIRARGQA